MTQCKPRKYEFQGIKGRAVEGAFDGGTITSDGGALLLRELCEREGYFKKFADCFIDYRNPELIEHQLETLLAQRIIGICLGYEDLDDHDELRKDPLLSIVCGEEDIEGRRRHQGVAKGIPLAGKSTLNRLELTPSTASAASRYKKIVYDEVKIEDFFVSTFLDSDTTIVIVTCRSISSVETNWLVHCFDRRTLMGRLEQRKRQNGLSLRFENAGQKLRFCCGVIRGLPEMS